MQFYVSRVPIFLLSITFSLFYSSQIGLESRAYFTFVATVSLLVTGLAITGISLHSRILRERNPADFNIAPYFGLIFVILVLNSGFTLTFIRIYQELANTPIPNSLVIVSVMYSCTAALTFGLQEGLLLLKRIRLTLLLDISNIFLQIALYFFFVSLQSLSTLVCVFLAYSFAYSFISFSTTVVLLTNFSFKLMGFFSGVRELLHKSWVSYFVAISEVTNDRLEKLFLGLIAAPALLSQYSVAITPMGIFRIIVDAFSKVHSVRGKNRVLTSSKYLLLFALLLSFLSAAFIYLLIRITLGSEWLLSPLVLLLICLQELLRAYLMMPIRQILYFEKKNYVIFYFVYSILCSLFVFPLSLIQFGTTIAFSVNLSLVILQVVLTRTVVNQIT